MKEFWNHLNRRMSMGRGWVYYITFFIILLAILVPHSFGSKNTFPVILTMESLGYDSSVTESVDLRTVGNEIERYELRIANTEPSDDHYEFLHVQLFHTPDAEAAENVLKEEMMSVKKSEQEWLSGCKENCISLSHLKEIDPDKDFFCLDREEWNAEKAYALYDYENYPDKKYYRNTVFLKKENRVAVLEFKTTFEITAQRIEVLKELIDQEIFE